MAFHPMLGNSYQLNTVAKEIITLLKEGKTKDEIVEAVSLKYEINRNEVYIDVSDFLAKLKIYQLV